MRYVNKITDEDRLVLEQMKRHNHNYMMRTRAHAILLSDEGMDVQSLAQVFDVCRQTISKWINVWETEGVDALMDKPRSGRPSRMADEIRRVQQNEQ